MDRPRSPTKFYTAGYDGRDLASLLEVLAAAGVRTVVDVRQLSGSEAITREELPADDIAALLASRGIAYRPLPALGNTFWECADWRSRYAQFLGRVGTLMEAKFAGLEAPLCLLGAERRPADCHRTLIAAFLASRGHEIEHLEAE